MNLFLNGHTSVVAANAVSEILCLLWKPSRRDALATGHFNLSAGQSLLLYFIASLLRFGTSYAARVAFICEGVGRSGPDPDPPSVLCRIRLTDDENHPRGGIASHPGRG